MTNTDNVPIYIEIQRLELVRDKWIAEKKSHVHINDITKHINYWETRLQCGFYTCEEVEIAEKFDSEIENKIYTQSKIKKGSQLQLF